MRTFAALALAFLFGACSSEVTPTNGSATIVVTDAANDDIEVFEVDVTSITFTKASGSVVSAMARRTRVDFAQLDSLSELFVGLSLEPGFYTGLTLTLDFSTAVVYLTGRTTPATVLDANGDPLTGTVTIPVSFSISDRPSVVPARNHLFLLDLDLDQAVTTDLPNNRATFVPVVSVEVDPANPKPVFSTGYLMSVDAAMSRFVVEKRAVDGTPLGSFTVLTSQSTVFQIDGVVMVGTPGLAALAPFANGSTRVFAQGTVSAAQRLLAAVAVETGAGTPGNGQDWVEGLIVARDNGAGSDAALTVLGRSRVASTSVSTFNTLHTVNVSFADTKVLRRAAGNTLDSDSLGVGQRVVAFGTLAGTTLDATATTGVVRMLPTNVYGLATGAAAGDTLTLNLVRIGLRPIGDFNYMVGGVAQADPANYTVDVTGLTTTGITTGSKICANGWVNAVGVVGDDDSRAVGLVNRTNSLNLLLAAWVPASSMALGIATDALAIDANTALIKTVEDGFASTPLTASPTPLLRKLGIAGVFRIVENGSVQVHFTFGTFQTAVLARLAAGARVSRLAALGTFQPAPQLFDTFVATVVLQ